ncbi:MAG: phospho-sugar mutase [Parachlamydia sp.]|nr:phospho-sugar mutase [Parachlamydia sp.]
MDAATQRNVEQWLEGDYDPETKAAVRKMGESDLVDAFYKHLSFGTGGMRGIMGIGCNRFNRYTVAAAVQGLANYLLKQTGSERSVLIGYDSRHHSREFAEESAKVLAGNGIQVYLFPELRPTPLVSFGCRWKKCSAAIMITASHNPPAYNGLKVFWSDGGQILPPHDQNIIAEVKRIGSPSQVKRVDAHPLIQFIGREIDEAYLSAIQALQTDPEQNRIEGRRLNIVYTSLHGTGITLVTQALQSWGFTQVALVEEQCQANGDFPTVSSPNPEVASALKMGMEQMVNEGADLLIANDPDADRLGIAVQHHGKAQIINGNQIACILLEHLLKGRLPEEAAFVKSIATTELFQAICEHYQRPCFNVLPGFKYFNEKILEWEKSERENRGALQFIFGAEESLGYLAGTLTHDKDGIAASLLLCEAALQAKLKGETLIDKLNAIYEKYGFHLEKQLTITFEEGKEGSVQIKQMIQTLIRNPPREFCHIAVEAMEDYNTSVRTDLKSGRQSALTLPKSNVLLFWLQDGSKLMVRPSGTEPKIKIYCGVCLKKFQDLDAAHSHCEQHAEALMQDLRSRLTV